MSKEFLKYAKHGNFNKIRDLLKIQSVQKKHQNKAIISAAKHQNNEYLKVISLLLKNADDYEGLFVKAIKNNDYCFGSNATR